MVYLSPISSTSPHQHGVFSSTHHLSGKMTMICICPLPTHPDLGIVHVPGCCDSTPGMLQTFMQDLLHGNDRAVAGVSEHRLNELRAGRTVYVLKQVHKLWQDQGLNNNHLEARKCSFVSFAAQNLLLSLN